MNRSYRAHSRPYPSRERSENWEVNESKNWQNNCQKKNKGVRVLSLAHEVKDGEGMGLRGDGNDFSCHMVGDEFIFKMLFCFRQEGNSQAIFEGIR